jgi:hypothetical protein
MVNACILASDPPRGNVPLPSLCILCHAPTRTIACWHARSCDLHELIKDKLCRPGNQRLLFYALCPRHVRHQGADICQLRAKLEARRA